MANNTVIQIWDDYHNERPGYFRAFYCNHPMTSIGSPCIGYCQPGGSQRTIKAAVAEIRQRDKETPIYRLGIKIA
jgi:hypothetical protein